MDNSQSKFPRMITDEFDSVCAYCKEKIYVEKVIGTLQEDNTYSYEKFVFGSYKQKCDSKGMPCGPVIPYCNCRNIS